MLNKSNENGYPCILPNIRENTFSFSLLRMMLVVGLSYVAFIMLRYALAIPNLLRGFFLIINVCWILSKAFFASMWFLFFNLWMWCITLIDFWIMNHSCISGINPTWSWCMILLKYGWIWLLKFYWGYMIFLRYWSLKFNHILSILHFYSPPPSTHI